MGGWGELAYIPLTPQGHCGELDRNFNSPNTMFLSFTESHFLLCQSERDVGWVQRAEEWDDERDIASFVIKEKCLLKDDRLLQRQEANRSVLQTGC